MGSLPEPIEVLNSPQKFTNGMIYFLQALKINASVLVSVAACMAPVLSVLGSLPEIEEVVEISSEVSNESITVKIKNISTKDVEVPMFKGRISADFWILGADEGALFAIKGIAELNEGGGIRPESLFW